MQSLLDKYLNGTITEPERQSLKEMLKSPEYQKQLEQVIDKEFEEHAYETEDNAAILSSIQANLNSRIDAEEASRRKSFFNLQNISIAAVFILLAGIGAYLFFNQKQPVTNQQSIVLNGTKSQSINNEKLPVLVLANGNEILLDSTAMGRIADEQGVEISKPSANILAYHSVKNIGKGLSFNTIKNPKGSIYQVILADGSKVWLNAASSLRYPVAFAGKERVVELIGEGYFEVAKIASMPFHVKVNKVDVKVLGTHFNVNGYNTENAVRTSLLEGSVEVISEAKNALLKPGQQASVTSEKITIANSIDMDGVMAWKNGLFRFNDAGIRTILDEAARWYDVEFVFEKEIKDTFSGQVSRTVDINQLLKILQLTGKVNFIVEGKKITVKAS